MITDSQEAREIAADIVKAAVLARLELGCGNLGSHVGCAFQDKFPFEQNPLVTQVYLHLTDLGFIW